MKPAASPTEGEHIRISDEHGIIVARQTARELARELGFGAADQTRLATAVSEITRNVLKYAQAGTCVVADDSDVAARRVRVSIVDSGPGIPDIDQAMRDGFSTGRSLGAGLPGAKRLVHGFSIVSEPGHTEVTLLMERVRGPQ